MNLVCVCVPAYLPFPNSQRRKACLAGMISLIQQFLLFSRLTGKPSRSVSHGQATVHSLELLLRGNASSHGNSYTGPLNTRLKTAADRLQCVFREPSRTCNFKTFFSNLTARAWQRNEKDNWCKITSLEMRRCESHTVHILTDTMKTKRQ